MGRWIVEIFGFIAKPEGKKKPETKRLSGSITAKILLRGRQVIVDV